MANANDILPHIGLPIPALKDLPKPASREERLRTIISNLDRQHQAVRMSIVADLKERLDHARAPGSMDIDHPRGRAGQPADDGMDMLFASLSQPYQESMGDLSVKEDDPLPQPPPNVRQATPPLEIQYAKDATNKIQYYDRTVAMPARQHYADALQRLQRRTSTGEAFAVRGAAASPWENINPLDPRRR